MQIRSFPQRHEKLWTFRIHFQVVKLVVFFLKIIFIKNGGWLSEVIFSSSRKFDSATLSTFLFSFPPFLLHKITIHFSFSFPNIQIKNFCIFFFMFFVLSLKKCLKKICVTATQKPRFLYIYGFFYLLLFLLSFILFEPFFLQRTPFVETCEITPEKKIWQVCLPIFLSMLFMLPLLDHSFPSAPWFVTVLFGNL